MNSISPVPPLTSLGFADPVWKRWLDNLRAVVVSATTSVVIESANGFTGSVVTVDGVAEVTLGVSVSGVLKGVSGGLVTATPGTDFVQTVSVTAPIINSGSAASPDIALDVSGVAAGTYGDSTHTVTLTVDTFGRVTAASASSTVLQSVSSGPTSSRPVSPGDGFTYLDTTLGQPVWHLSTATTGWVNAAGVSV